MSSDKKPRIDKIQFTTKEKVSQITFTYDRTRDGFILPDANSESIKVERSYDRDSGKPKVLSNVPGVTNFASFDVDRMLMEEYDYLISIDTNSRELKGKKISICTCYYVPGKLRQHKNGVPFYQLTSYIIVNPNMDVNPEQIGWALVINNNLKLPLDDKDEIMAIVVDSEKDSLPKYNTRSKPYLGQSYLPEQLKFCYASDKDKDTLPGQMLKMCHNVSNQIFRQMQLEKTDLPPLTNGGGLCDGYIVVREKDA
ncbi:hypothetical protein QWZ04_15970 [Vibrio tapetis subsp. quintayensis]|uniref:hypothetical protein n=1 Tax=Vibrio tapetis TaxID=52443 RepID=UPI0025B5677B|nr:hypothetical protein [Vibrio tapetis]MDN3681802.1 hypothetical protein [Vibrio tapetis subsp. quintayensis]